MSCIGVFIDEHTRCALFNPELALAQGQTVLTHCDPDADPFKLRDRLQARLRSTAPHARVLFLDHYSDLESEEPPEGDYALLIKQEAPMYSGSLH